MTLTPVVEQLENVYFSTELLYIYYYKVCCIYLIMLSYCQQSHTIF